MPQATCASSQPTLSSSPLVGQPAPSGEVAYQYDPGTTSVQDHAGDIVVVNFWASWCVPCVQEHPHLIALGKRAGVSIYGVNYKDQPSAARRFIGRYGNPYAKVGTDSNGRGAIEWGVYGMPETFVVDGKGRIAYKHVGPISPG